MIYEFKSRATGSMIATQDVAERILKIIGKTPQSQGVILPEQMPAAISALQRAIDEERKFAANSSATPTSNEKVEQEPPEPAVSLAQRAFPFIEMLQRASIAGKEITWGR